MPGIILIIALLPGTPAPADEALAEQARAAFLAGIAARDQGDAGLAHFAEAAAHYEALRARGAANVALFRNLGNAQLLAGQLPAAILAYRQGLRLDPTDRDLQSLLAAARTQVRYPDAAALGHPVVEERPAWLPRVRPVLWFPVAIAGYALALAGATRWWMNRSGAALALAGAGVAGIAVILLVQASRSAADAATHPVVVIADDGVLLRRGDALTFPPRYDTPLNRGVEARLLFARGDWLQIELADGSIGWAPRRYALVESE